MELKPVEKDVLLELSNVSMGSAVTALFSLLKRVARLSPPEIEEMTTAALQERYNSGAVLTRVDFKNSLEGTCFLLLKERDAAFLAGLMPEERESTAQDAGVPGMEAVGEAMSILMGSYAASLATFLGIAQVPDTSVELLATADRDFGALGFAEEERWVIFTFLLEIEPDESINLIQLFPRFFLQNILTPLMKGLGIDIDDEESTVQNDSAKEGPPPELEALLNPEGDFAAPAANLPSLDDFLNELEKDTLAEIGNISLGSSATALSQLVDQRVQITTPKLSLTTMEKLGEQYPLSSVIARINYQEGLQGESILILKEEDAALIAGLMLGLPAEDAPRTVGEMEMSAVSEAMNQMMGSAATAMSQFLDRKIDISPPRLLRADLDKEIIQVNQIDPSEPVLQISFQLTIGDLLQSRLIQIIPFPFAKEISSFLLQNMAGDDGEIQDFGLPAYDAAPVAPAPEGSGESLSEMQKDALAEVGNISLGASATALSELINKKVNITAPQVTLTTMKEVSLSYPVPCLVVMVNYVKGLDGNNILIINQEDALVIIGLMMGMEPPERPQELNELEISAISEAMNQMMGSAATAMSDFLDRMIDISPPEILYTKLNDESQLGTLHFDENMPLVQVAFRMEVEGLIDSTLLQLIPLDFASEITSFLLSAFTGQEVPEHPEPVQDHEVSEVDETPAPPDEPAREEEEVPIFAGEEQAAVVSFPGGAAAKQLSDEEYAKLNLIKDIPLEIRAVLGKARMPLKRVFSLLPGEIIGLNRFLGEPVELFAHERLVATGEVVLVNGQFGVKITEIVRPKY
ncbi:MAG: flagellar motor switch phosphatase FliY [Firmicutes bacterium]|nr:flagellar motor switch phosphatase FliY [Bacillota bacterium]